jgi:hypothetical protein
MLLSRVKFSMGGKANVEVTHSGGAVERRKVVCMAGDEAVGRGNGKREGWA